MDEPRNYMFLMKQAGGGTEYGRLVRQAKEAVEGLEEPLRSLGFQKVLDDLLRKEAPTTGDSAVRTASGRSKARVRNAPMPKANSSKGPSDQVQALMEGDLDASEYDPLFESRGNIEAKSLAVLALADKHGFSSGLTAPEIAKLLKEKLRVGQVHESNVSLLLGKARSLFDRRLEGRAYRYRATRKGAKFLSERMQAVAGKVK